MCVCVFVCVYAFPTVSNISAVPNDPRRVIVQKLAVLVEGKSDVEIDLTGGSLIFLFCFRYYCIIF